MYPSLGRRNVLAVSVSGLKHNPAEARLWAKFVYSWQCILRPKVTRMTFLRVVTWNLNEGRQWCPDNAQNNSCMLSALDAIAGALASLRPDLVLLNEIVVWNSLTWGGLDQVSYISNAIGLPHIQKARTATLALKGEKNVVVLSRFPLRFERRIQHSAYWDGGGYSTLHVSFVVNGIRHHVFSTRITAYDAAENARSHDELVAAVRALPTNEPVLLGGDFNTGFERWDAQGQPTRNHVPVAYSRFCANSGLSHVLGGIGWSNPSPDDHLFFRGQFSVLRSDRTMPHPGPSDHEWVTADLLPLNWQQPNRSISGLAVAVPTTDELLVVRSAPVQSRSWKPQGGWGSAWVANGGAIIHGNGPSGGTIAVVSERGRSHLFFITADGAIAALERQPSGAWRFPWQIVVGSNRNTIDLAVPGGAVSGVSSSPGLGEVHVFYATASGATMAVIGNTDFYSWRTPEWVRSGLTAPGGHITGVCRRSGFVDIFTVGTDRRVYTAAWTTQRGWAGWWPIPGILAPPGAPIAAVSRRQDFLDIFVADDAGRIMSAAWSPGSRWKGWWHIQNGFTAPGGCISAVSRATDLLDIFTVGMDSRMYSAAWNPSHGWGGWWALNVRGQRPGAAVASASRSINILDIFVIDAGGVVQTMGWAPGGNWGGPWALPG